MSQSHHSEAYTTPDERNHARTGVLGDERVITGVRRGTYLLFLLCGEKRSGILASKNEPANAKTVMKRTLGAIKSGSRISR